MTADEIFREYVKFSLNLLPVSWKERFPGEIQINVGPNSHFRCLIEVQGAALAHIIKKLEAEQADELRIGLKDFCGKEPK